MYSFTKDPYTTDIFYTDNSVIRVKDFTEDAAKAFSEAFYKAENGPSEFIPIIIDSYGGSAHSVLGMVDLILSTKKKVLTYIQAKAMSAGIILTAFGTPGYRFAGPLSHIMFHQPNTWNFGTLADVKNSVKHTELLHNKICRQLAIHCGQSESYFLDLVEKNKNLDIFMEPDEAIQHRLIDRIGVPNLIVERHTTYRLDVL